MYVQVPKNFLSQMCLCIKKKYNKIGNCEHDNELSGFIKGRDFLTSWVTISFLWTLLYQVRLVYNASVQQTGIGKETVVGLF
jgi:hypothetical protein